MTVAGGNGRGSQLDQLYLPAGICVDSNQTLYVADMGNDRVVAWKLNETIGRLFIQQNKTNSLRSPTDIAIDKRNRSLIIADHDNQNVIRCSCENSTGKKTSILNIGCFGVATDKDGSIYISDRKKHQVQRWGGDETCGALVVAGGNKEGQRLNQLNNPSFIFVDDNYSLYISDSWNHRVVKWFKGAREGIIVAGGCGQGSRLKQLSYPNGIYVDQFGQIYVADTGNHRIMCWREGAREGMIVVGKHHGEEFLDELKGPISLTFDLYGNLYVADQWNHRIQKFEIDDGNNKVMLIINIR